MTNTSLAEQITAYYENHAQSGMFSYFDKIGFLNVGYWKGIEDNIEMAQINLMETLTRFFHETGGTVLDAACGRGAAARFLTKYFDPHCVTGINISEPQISICRTTAPECNFELMDAAQLTFASSSFDNILCIEAAGHFMTRQNFFEQSLRVLKPSGRMAMLDVLYDHDFLSTEEANVCPRENYLPNLDALREMLLRVGFRYVRIDDCTELTAKSACRYVVKMLEREFGRTEDPAVLERINSIRQIYKAAFSWGLVYAIK